MKTTTDSEIRKLKIESKLPQYVSRSFDNAKDEHGNTGLSKLIGIVAVTSVSNSELEV
jgi:hypothetical protein